MAIKRRSSPDRVELKKQKTRAAEPPAELSKGAKWMIQQIDHMQQAYKVYVGRLILVKLSLMQVLGSLDRCSVNNSASKSSQEFVSTPRHPLCSGISVSDHIQRYQRHPDSGPPKVQT